MTQLETVIGECWQTAEEHGFHGVSRTFGDTCMLITTEIGEAFEAFRKDGHHKPYTEVDGKPEGTVVELLDAVIRIFDTCLEECGMTTAEVVQLLTHKMEYNKRRPHLHSKVI